MGFFISTVSELTSNFHSLQFSGCFNNVSIVCSVSATDIALWATHQRPPFCRRYGAPGDVEYPDVLREGKSFLVLGARGGSRITTAVAQIIINVIDFGMNIQEAVDSPRVHHQWLPDELLYEPRGLSQDAINNLTRMGYLVKDIGEPLLGRAQALMFDATSGFFYGGPDPREEGVALGF
jgi:hypothetical protein